MCYPRSRSIRGRDCSLSTESFTAPTSTLARRSFPYSMPKDLKRLVKKISKTCRSMGPMCSRSHRRCGRSHLATHPLPASTLEGYAYQEDAAGARSYDPTKLRTETAAVTIEVVPFRSRADPDLLRERSAPTHYQLSCSRRHRWLWR